MQRTFYNGHLYIEGIIFRYQFILTPIIADTPNNWPYKIFLLRNFYTCYFTQCFTILFKFPSICKENLRLYGLFRSIEIKIHKNFLSVINSMVDVFLSRKDVKSAMGQRQKHGNNHGDFCSTWPTTSSLQWEVVRTTVFLSTSPLTNHFTLLCSTFVRV